MGRYLVVESIKRNLYDKCEISLSYCIRKAEPTTININTLNSRNENEISKFISNFDLTNKDIIN